MGQAAGFFLHFYQPPRENPWLGLVPNEWSAWPYHDWNERITAECYRAMVAVALPGDGGGATELFEPLTSSCFDVGPTLHHWFEDEASDVDQALGHQVRLAPGSAIAAPLVHAILPLAKPADRDRLIAWGIADYRRRFGVAPLGMWLPETAVDIGTLDALARQGVRYTVLMPQQAARVRAPDGSWRRVDAHSLDTSRPYSVRLPEGRSITVVFGHGELSQRVAFGDLIDDGTKVADTLMAVVAGHEDGLVLLVADGETYGHHHRFGDIGLAWALRHLQRNYGVTTALGEWLDVQDSTYEVELQEVSSWSCAHGVERWRSDCGCTTGSRPGWRQSWRAPLRETLDWLREAMGTAADVELARYVTSVEETLLDYGDAICGAVARADFVASHASRTLDDDELSTVLELCEIHRHLLYAFTSCAWFFADPAEIETAIVLRHAAVALELAERVLGSDLRAELLVRLPSVRSNRRGVDGAVIWRRATERYRFDEHLIAAGFAAELLANETSPRMRRGVWLVEREPQVEGSEIEVLRISLTNTNTLRTSRFVATAERTGALGARVRVRANATSSWVSYELAELGSDVVAVVAASWLVGPGSTDYERALDLLVVDTLRRRTSDDDAAVLVALAGALRCVSPGGESSIRRALLAITSRVDAPVNLDLLTPLAQAVGLSHLVGGF